MLHKKLITLLFYLMLSTLMADKPYELTVAKIMQDPKWIGISPSNIHWSEDGKWIYFNWNPDGAESDSLYKVSPKGGDPKKVSPKERLALPARYGDYTKNFMKKVYAKNGDIFILDIKSGNTKQVTNTVGRESSPRFSGDEKSITYIADGNLYRWYTATGKTVQLTDFRKNKTEDDNEPKTAHEKWLKQEELKLITVLEKRKAKREKREETVENEKPKRPLEIVHGKKNVQNIQSSPDGKFVSFRLYKAANDAERTIVPSYVTESGFTTDLNAREKGLFFGPHLVREWEAGRVDSSVSRQQRPLDCEA